MSLSLFSQRAPVEISRLSDLHPDDRERVRRIAAKLYARTALDLACRGAQRGVDRRPAILAAVADALTARFHVLISATDVHAMVRAED